MYSKKVLRHFTNPKYAGELKSANGIGEVGNPKCGDVMKVFLEVKNGVIEDIKFLTYGCPAAIASSDVMCGLVKGRKINEALKIKAGDIVKELGELPPIKYHCSVLGRQALKKAVEDYKKNENYKR